MAKYRRKHKFLTTLLEKSDFISVENFTKSVTNQKIDVAKRKVSWLRCHERQLIKEQVILLFMKSDLNQEHQPVKIEKRGEGRKPSIKDIALPVMWPDGRPLSTEKLEDLKELYKLVPRDTPDFYKVVLLSNTA
ncbi:hypothetical protein JTB14_000398 [Gonioctena quinquepunctata]|nr:hypothetical protein JTB14_000398 [Gonioctena quinquepunctata]